MENQENTSTGSNAAAETETATAQSTVNFAPGTIGIKKKFNFKQRTVKDESGKEVDKLPKQPSVDAMIPVPTADAVIAVLSQPDTLTTTINGETKEVANTQKSLILDYIYQIIFDQAKSQLDATIDSFGADKTKQISVADLDYDKLSLAYIASIPPARRGAIAISDEEWKEFFTDYGNVMSQGAGKTKTQIENHIKILERPRNYRAKKDLLGVMRDQLNIYAQLAANLEDFTAQYQRLQDQISRFIEEEDKIDITAL